MPIKIMVGGSELRNYQNTMFQLQENPIDTTKTKNIGGNGALVSFEGVVRADVLNGKHVASLLYIADAPVCVVEGEKIINEALQLFPISYADCIQRIGSVAAGEPAIWIGVGAGHRDEAFKACRYIIEEIKKRLLIWKKEFYTDGSSRWIHGAETKDMHL